MAQQVWNETAKSEATEHKYDDIINLPHHQSATRKHMSNYERAAQFAPFAALTGHSDAIDETAVENEARMNHVYDQFDWEQGDWNR